MSTLKIGRTRKMRMTPTEKAFLGNCLPVDDDPLVLRSTAFYSLRKDSSCVS